jgi:hypothetical protein
VLLLLPELEKKVGNKNVLVFIEKSGNGFVSPPIMENYKYRIQIIFISIDHKR